MLRLSGYGETAIWAMTNDMQPQRRLQACTTSLIEGNTAIMKMRYGQLDKMDI